MPDFPTFQPSNAGLQFAQVAANLFDRARARNRERQVFAQQNQLFDAQMRTSALREREANIALRAKSLQLALAEAAQPVELAKIESDAREVQRQNAAALEWNASARAEFFRELDELDGQDPLSQATGLARIHGKYSRFSVVPGAGDEMASAIKMRSGLVDAQFKSAHATVNRAAFSAAEEARATGRAFASEEEARKNPRFAAAVVSPVTYRDELTGEEKTTWIAKVDESGNPVIDSTLDGVASTKLLAAALSGNVEGLQKVLDDPVLGVVASTAGTRANATLMKLVEAQQKRASEDPAGPLTPGQEQLDKEFAKTYNEWRAAGGIADAVKNIEQLRGVIRQLRDDEKNLTGPIVGRVPDISKSFFNPEAIDVREQVEEVVQRNLRLILGAQFTEREGERLISRAFNPKLPEEVNVARLERLIQSMQLAAQAKESAAQYFDQHGTLRGWTGRLPTTSDFETALDGKTTTVSTSDL